jgi:hypothetical protein
VGGTSVSTQVFGGIMALVNQRFGPQGNINYLLYPLAANNGNTCVSNVAAVTTANCVFYDIQNGNNSVMCQGGTPDCSNTSTTSGQYGIIVTGSPAVAAYSATPGYDLATGLGSVNVTNLVNNWNSVNFNPTTITLSPIPAATPVTLTHGQPFNFTASVVPTAGSGTPLGDISLIAQSGSSSSNATGIGPFTLGTDGSITSSTLALPGGSYTVSAHYAGNGTYAASNSSPGVPVIVGPENSQAFLTLITFDSSGNITSTNASSANYGSNYLFRMDVTNSSGSRCISGVNALTVYPCPTGSLTLSPAPTDPVTPQNYIPGHYTLNSDGYAEEQFSQQPPSVYNFALSYGGDQSYNPSHSNATITIATGPTTLSTLTGTVNDAGTNQNEYLHGYITTQQSDGAAPGGTVQFYDGGVPLGAPAAVSGNAYYTVEGYPVYAAGQATLGIPLSLGTHTISAQYSGDVNYASASAPTYTLIMSDFSLTLNPSTISIPAGQTGKVNISVTSLNGFAGPVSFQTFSAVLYPAGTTYTYSPSTVTLSANATATATLIITTTGTPSALSSPRPTSPPGTRSPLEVVEGLAGLLALILCLTWRTTSRSRFALSATLALLFIATWIACGGGGGGGVPTPTPPAAPAVTFSPASLAFGTQILSTTSTARSATLTNSGNATLNITDIFVQGDASDFSQTNTCGSTVAVGGTCSFSVKFTPLETGARTGYVEIDDNTTNSPQSLALTGTGAPVPTPPGTYAFQVVATGDLTLPNAGTGAVHYAAFNVTVQ